MNAGNRKSGFLNKRSEGRLRNVWQRRKCEVREGLLNICHADESKQPTKVNLLTCQMKPVADDRLCFDVVSYNRTYHFQASIQYLFISLFRLFWVQFSSHLLRPGSRFLKKANSFEKGDLQMSVAL